MVEFSHDLFVIGLVIVGFLLYGLSVWVINKIATKYFDQQEICNGYDSRSEFKYFINWF